MNIPAFGALFLAEGTGFLRILWNGGDLPMLSPPTMQEGRHVARPILDRAARRAKTRKPFRYSDKGTMATVGRNAAVAQIRLGRPSAGH
jgi:NADH dehydrogenase